MLIFCISLIAIASLLTLNFWLIVGSLIIATLLVAFYRLNYIVDSLVFKHTNLIQVLDGCELSGDRSTAIRRLGNVFCATAVASMLNNSGESIDRQKIDNIISNSHCTFRFVLQVEKLDINKLLDRLQTKRGMKEIELARLKNNPKDTSSKTGALRREIELIDHEIEKVGMGGAPLKVAQYIMTSAVSDSKFSAQENAKSQLRELVSEFGALIGTKSEILSGNDLLDQLKFDAVIQ